MKIKVEINSIKTLFSILGLEENTLYKVAVKCRANNPEHVAFLFTGFKNGNYCEIYNNSYDSPISLESVYSIKKIKKLAKTK